MSKIVIKAKVNPASLSGKMSNMNADVWINPKYDPSTMTFVVGDTRYKGKRSNPADSDSEVIHEVDGVGVILSDQSLGIPISNDMILDTSIPRDKFVLDLAVNSGFVAPSLSEFNSTAGHRFYVKDEEKEAEKTSHTADLAFEAMGLIRNMTLEERRDLARILGQYVLRMTDTKIDGYLKQLCIDKPKKIIEALADRDYNYRVFIKKLTDANILRFDQGKYMYDQQLIGVDMDHVVAFIKDAKNADLVTAWGRLINKGEVVDVADEVVSETVGRRGRKPA